jgi:hypothetical protein
MNSPFESLATFQEAIRVMPLDASERLRTHFIESRLDPQQAEQAEALRVRRFADGLGYSGYLWDFLVDKHVVSEEELWHGVGVVPEVYVMWDLHTAERVSTPDYFRFPQATVLRTDPKTLRRGLEYLPEDLYIFDETFAWAAALTHEWEDDHRFCLWSGDRVR